MTPDATRATSPEASPQTATQTATQAPSASRVPGPEANERLTAWAGTALLLLLAAEGATIATMFTGVGPAPWRERATALHILIGLVLVPPLLQKVGSTGYRFARYYSGEPDYRRAGPPHLVMRVLAPVLLALTAEVMLTGLALPVLHTSWHGRLEDLHRWGFYAWFAVTAVHVAVYVWRVPRLVGPDLRPPAPDRPGARRRAGVTLAGITLGVCLSVPVCLYLDVISL